MNNTYTAVSAWNQRSKSKSFHAHDTLGVLTVQMQHIDHHLLQPQLQLSEVGPIPVLDELSIT